MPLHYIEDAPRQAPQPQQPLHGADKYHGDIAFGYDEKREADPKWTIEQSIIEGMIAELAPGSTVLDCPVGTGRFLKCYADHKLEFVGIDKSGDMLVQSALKLLPQAKVEDWVAACNAKDQIMPLKVKDRGTLMMGDVRQLPIEDKSVDAAVMCRLTRWLSPDECQQAIRELQRVCRKRIIWTARVANHKHARSVALFEHALDGWRITRNEAGYVTDYRILCCERDGA